MQYTNITQGLTFDDVLLEPGFSNVSPEKISISTKITKDISINIPIVSAAMDTVTEFKTAIAMAQEGGIGIIHRNLSPKDQAKQVLNVKKSESGMILNPITTTANSNVGDVINTMKKHNISGLPVTENDKLIGIVTYRDIRFEKNYDKLVKDIMTKKVITACQGTSHQKAKEILHKYKIEKLPLIEKETHKLLGLFTVKDIEKTKKYPNASKDSIGRLMVGAAIGRMLDAKKRCEILLNSGVDILVVDTAHAHSQEIIDTVKFIKNNFKKYDYQLIVGNIATSDAAKALVDLDVDAIKVGIGPGSICTTRIVTGIGVPQLTAISQVFEIVKKKDIPIIADGGIKYSGDIIKALAAGASSVMIGSMFAGTEESPGKTIIYKGRTYKSYRGMGSINAMVKGGADRYGQLSEDISKLVPEGIEGRVSYKGSLNSNIYQLIGGLKSGMIYIGAQNIADISKKAKFIKMSHAGLKESHVHDVDITQEAPNYRNF